MPYIAAAGELKTKPTQHSVKELRSIGIQPDVLAVPQDDGAASLLFDGGRALLRVSGERGYAVDPDEVWMTTRLQGKENSPLTPSPFCACMTSSLLTAAAAAA